MERSKAEDSPHSWLKHWPRLRLPRTLKESVRERKCHRETLRERARERKRMKVRESEREKKRTISLTTASRVILHLTHFLVFTASGSSDTPTHSLIIHVDINDNVDHSWHVKKTPPCAANCTGNCCTFIFFQNQLTVFSSSVLERITVCECRFFCCVDCRR